MTADEFRQGRRYAVIEQDKGPSRCVRHEMPVPEISERLDVRIEGGAVGRGSDEAPAVAASAFIHLHIRDSNAGKIGFIALRIDGSYLVGIAAPGGGVG